MSIIDEGNSSGSGASAALSTDNTSGTLTTASAAPSSAWQRLSARRIAFFARHEGLFLWLLGVPLLLVCAAALVFFLLWLTGQASLLEWLIADLHWF